MIILGIETSCDETSAAVVENGHRVLAAVTASSEKLHHQTGGIIPETAAREQLRFMVPVLEKTLKQFRPQKPFMAALKDIDALAVTYGPGLIGSLLVGTETAKTLAVLTSKPLTPVNHLEAHIFGNWLEKKPKDFPPLPGLALIASGGHTELVLVKKTDHHYQFSWLGGTRDDAAGECFDKCARALGLGYPGGPAISALAKEATKKLTANPPFSLPRPMIDQKNHDFSFSGLKTALINRIRQLELKQIFNQEIKAFLSWEVQEAIADVLVKKTMAAAQDYQTQAVILGGGVTANQVLRDKFSRESQLINLPLFIPETRFCTDNGTIIASAGYFNHQPISWQNLTAVSSLRI